jgi:YggT family protein
MNVIYSLFAAALDLLGVLLSLYIWVLIIGAVLSWLVAFDVINTRNRFVQVVGDIVYRLTEPLLRPIRRFLPPIGGLDLSPLILIFAIMFLQSFIRHLMVM